MIQEGQLLSSLTFDVRSAQDHADWVKRRAVGRPVTGRPTDDR
jgi:hypothetical protein